MRRSKIISAFTAIIVSAFLFPATVYAVSDYQPPIITAELIGELIHIEARDNDSGVESVYVDKSRFNYRVDGTLKVNARDNHGNAEYISVYAIDFAGNKSNAVRVRNPYYNPPVQVIHTPTPTTTPVPTTPPPVVAPVQVPVVITTPQPDYTEQAAFTPSGTGTVLDNIIQQNGKEFFTFTTEDGNVFYLTIDRQRDGENVYLLNAVTETDLMALAEGGVADTSQSAIPVPEPIIEVVEVEPAPEPTPEKPVKSNTGVMIFITIAVLAVGGAGYYFKIVKPKQQSVQTDDDLFGEDMEYDDPDDEDYDETEENYAHEQNEPEETE